MCRWLAYSGSPVLLDDILVSPVHSLIDQSLHSQMGAHTRIDRQRHPADQLPPLQARALAVEPALYPDIEGSTDTGLFFYLALTFGLKNDPPLAIERAVGFIERVGRAHGVEHPMQMTVATTDGANVWAFRYSSEGRRNPPDRFGTAQ